MCEGRSPFRTAGDYSVEEKESRRWRCGEPLGMKSLEYSVKKKITTLLGEEEDPCVNFRVLIQNKV